jgi:hypothetical protein
LIIAALNIPAAAQMPDAATRPRLTGQATSAPGGVSLEPGDAGAVMLAANGATRRQILARLFADREVVIVWRNEVFAAEKVHGSFSGTPTQITRRLLAGRTFIITYDTSSGMPRIVRIAIPGPHPPSVSGSRAAAPARSALKRDGRRRDVLASVVAGKVVLEFGDGDNVMLLANGVPLRQVLDRLFARREVVIQWRNAGLAEEKVRGHFRGTLAQVARTLLDHGSYVIAYDTSGDRPRILRIIVIGFRPAGGQSKVSSWLGAASPVAVAAASYSSIDR